MVAILRIIIFVQLICCVYGYISEISCPKGNNFEIRSKAYLKLEKEVGEFCISCRFLFGGPVSKQLYITTNVLFMTNYYFRTNLKQIVRHLDYSKTKSII